jgi:hypothetical protein
MKKILSTYTPNNIKFNLPKHVGNIILNLTAECTRLSAFLISGTKKDAKILPKMFGIA